MDITKFETHGRRLLVEFTCARCKTTVVRPLEDCIEEVAECYRDLYDLQPPVGWEDGGFYYKLFCPKCKEAYKRFMSGEGVYSCEKGENEE